MKKTNKKPLIAIAVLAVVGIVAGTIAYFTSSATFNNVFKTKTYNTEMTEEFKSPDNWTPGTQTTKDVTVKNTGEIDLAVRVSYTESWVSADGTSRPELLTVTVGEGATAVEQRSVLLHKPDAEKDNWEEKGGYHYYKKALSTNQSATFIDYVTFNENVDIEYDETTVFTYEDTTTESVTGPNAKPTKETDTNKVTKQVKTYTSKSDGYAGATYTLTIKVETVQYDKYAQAWTGAPTINPAA